MSSQVCLIAHFELIILIEFYFLCVFLLKRKLTTQFRM